ncbi:MAG: hypothetical protein ACI84E_002218, partial [Planctomycetota bacterium]
AMIESLAVAVGPPLAWTYVAPNGANGGPTPSADESAFA